MWVNHGYLSAELYARRAATGARTHSVCKYQSCMLENVGRIVTAMVTLAMLAISAVLLYYANKQKQVDAVPAACSMAVCPPLISGGTSLLLTSCH